MKLLLIKFVIIIFLTLSMTVQANVLKITQCEFDKKTREISYITGRSYGLNNSDLKYYILQTNSGNIIADISSEPFFNRLSPNDVDGMKAMLNDQKFYFKRRLIIAFHSEAKKSNRPDSDKLNKMTYCIEEMRAIEGSSGTYSLEYMKLNRLDLNNRFGKLQNGENIDDIVDTSHDNMIIEEDEYKVTFLSFDYGQENPFKTNTALGRYMYNLDVPAVVDVPFIFNIKYQNSEGQELFLDRIAPVEVTQLKIKKTPIEISQYVQYNLHLLLIPFKYENGKMDVRIHILRERELYVDEDSPEAIYYSADEKDLVFDPTDVIEVKLDEMYPIEGKIDIGVKGESVTIKPIKK